MLNESDIEYMKDAQDEIYTLRQRPISLIAVEEVFDDFTGESLGKIEKERAAHAVITEIAIRSKDGARNIIGGIEIEQGDIKIDIKIEQLENAGDVIRAEFDGKKYELLGGDRKGIGVRNRIEFIGREIS